MRRTVTIVRRQLIDSQSILDPWKIQTSNKAAKRLKKGLVPPLQRLMNLENQQNKVKKKMMNNDEVIRQRNKDAYQKAALFWIELANKSLSSFNNHLLTLAVILLPLTASIVVTNFVELREFEKALLVISWLSLVISLGSGVVQLIIDANYFVYLSRDSSAREEIWSGTEPIDEMSKKTKLLGKTNPKSSLTPLLIQTIMLGQGVLLILAIAISILLRK